MATHHLIHVTADMTLPTKPGSKKKFRIRRGQSLGNWTPAAAQRLKDEAAEEGWLDGIRVDNVKLVPIKVRIR